MGEEGRCEKIARRPRENAYVVNRDGESRCFTVNSSVEIESRLDSIDSPYFVWFLTRLRSSSFHFHLFCVTSRLRLKYSTSFLRQEDIKKKNCTSNSCETRCKMKSHRIRMVKSRYIYTHTYRQLCLNINLIAYMSGHIWEMRIYFDTCNNFFHYGIISEFVCICQKMRVGLIFRLELFRAYKTSIEILDSNLK